MYSVLWRHDDYTYNNSKINLRISLFNKRGYLTESININNTQNGLRKYDS